MTKQELILNNFAMRTFCREPLKQTHDRVKFITSQWNKCMYISDRDMYRYGDKYDMGDKIIQFSTNVEKQEMK